MEIRSNALVAVVGAGTMGAGIAQVAAAAGHPVLVLDTNEDALEKGRAIVAKSLAGLVKRGRVEPAVAEDITTRIRWSTDMSSAANAALVVEAIVEHLDIKISLFRQIEAAVSDEAVLASNTSSLSIGEIASALGRPERFIGLHFFNPVPAMRLVEVVSGPSTAQAVAGAAAELMVAWGKKPVAVRDVPGFIVNRVARPYYGEGFAALGEGVPAGIIDAALSEAGGFRMGPLALADLIGHDVNYAVACSVYEAYDRKTRFRPQDAQKHLFEADQLGRKSCRGVYDYEAPLPPVDYAPDAPAPALISMSEPGLLAPLVLAAREAGLPVSLDPSLPPETLAIAEVVLGLGDGRLLAHRPGVDVLLDHARDFASAGTLVFSAKNSNDVARVAGFLQAIGRKALVIEDRPGQLVLRTLAQLANAAADAVIDDVASAEAIDDALLHGANHPQGPLAWADQFGVGRVGAVLANLASESGDGMYRPSTFFHRHG